jgi:exosortase K
MKKKYVIVLYIIGLMILLGMKYLYSKASCEELDFILAPTARWVTILGRIDFTKKADVGYINHNIRFIIAPGCSGVQFMLITFSTIFFPFVHRMNSLRKGVCWIAGSFVFSYPFTIFINGIRILLAIYIPVYFNKWNITADWLTAERLHTIIGTVVYVVALLAVYPLAGLVSKSKGNSSTGIPDKCKGKLPIKMLYRFLPPMLCYFSVTLVIPFLHNAHQNDFNKFLDYARLITSVCFAVILVSCIAYAIREHLMGKK